MSNVDCVPVIRNDSDLARAVTLLQELHHEEPLDRDLLVSLMGAITAYEAQILKDLEPEPLTAVHIRLGDLDWDVNTLARNLDADPQEVHACLVGEREPSASLVLRIATALSLPVGLIARAFSAGSSDTQPVPFAGGAVAAAKGADASGATAH